MTSIECTVSLSPCAGVMAKIKEKADSVGQKIQAKVDSSGLGSSPTGSAKGSPSLGRRGSPKINVCSQVDTNLTMEIAQLFMSCLHAWGLDPDLDKLCVKKLGLLKPQCPISFGLISRSGHMSLMLPGWHKKVCHEEMGVPEPRKSVARGCAPPGKATLKQQARSASYSEMERNPMGGDYTTTDSDLDSDHSPLPMHSTEVPVLGKESCQQQEMKIFSSKARWQISSGVTTQHLLSVISTANTLMSMSHATFATKRVIKKHIKG